MAQTKVGWRAYVNPISSLLTSIYGVWNGDGTNNTTVKNAWNANGNANDSKGSANGTIVTPNSTTGYNTSSMTYSTGKLGTASFTFNGSNFVSLPNNTFTFTNDFTVSCWFFVPTNYVSNAHLLSAFDNTGSYPSYFGWWIGYDSTNKKIYFNIGDSTQGSYGNVNLSTANNTITPGQWNHVMVTRKRSTRSRIYINGVLSNSNTNTANPLYSNGWSSIGSYYFAFSQPFWAAANAGLKIDAVQTWESELDQAVVTELYNSGNGQEYPFTTSNLLIASPNDSVSANHGTLMNGCTFATGKIGQAFTFDGVNDYVNLPNNSLNSLTSDFSVSGWLYMPANTSNLYCVLLSNVSNDYTTGKGWNIFTYGNNIYFDVFYSGVYQNPNSAYIRLQANNTLTNNAWNHIAIARKNSTSSKIYINGSLVGSNTSALNPATPTAAITPTIGVLSSVGVGNPQGSYAPNGSKVDALSVWNKELSAADVTELYNSGTGKQYPY
jgi:hypothetical protein